MRRARSVAGGWKWSNWAAHLAVVISRRRRSSTRRARFTTFSIEAGCRGIRKPTGWRQRLIWADTIRAQTAEFAHSTITVGGAQYYGDSANIALRPNGSVYFQHAWNTASPADL